MIGILGWVLALVVIVVRVRRRRQHAPRALLLAAGLEDAQETAPRHAVGADQGISGAALTRIADRRVLLQFHNATPSVQACNAAVYEGPARGQLRGDGVVWHALTEQGLKAFENASVAGHKRCS